MLALLLRRVVADRTLDLRGRRAASTLLIILSALGLLLGVFPLAALLLLVVGIVLKAKRPAAAAAG